VPRLVFRSEIAASVEELARFHASTRALYLLKPPLSKFWMEPAEVEMVSGARVSTFTQVGPITVKWSALITEAGPTGFHDISEEGPFRTWSHWHRFKPNGTGSILEDDITYETGKGALLDFLASFGIRAYFWHRHRVTKRSVVR